MIILETKRLILRHLTLDDLEELAALYADPDVMRYFASGPRSREATLQGLNWLLTLYEKQGFGLYAAIHKPSNRFIGRCGLLLQELHGAAEIEVAYMFAKEYWGQGLATEAARALRDFGFEHFAPSRLIAIVHPDNLASQHVARNTGMEYIAEHEHSGIVCKVFGIAWSQSVHPFAV